MIDLVCHLGSRFGYATHAAWVASALAARGRLNRIVNLDDIVHPDHRQLEPHLARPKGERVLVISGIFGLDTFGWLYGEERSALFLCPNTDRLSAPMVEATKSYGVIIVPSDWCAASVEASTGRKPERILPLGVDPAYLAARARTRAALRTRLSSPPSLLHMSTDGFWPGRKGTKELLGAWASLRSSGALGEAKLTLHVTAPNEHVVYYGCLDRGLDVEALSMKTAPPRGSTIDELIELMAAHDGIVLPTRCEGFGMQALAAYVLGIPLLTTLATGHLMFLGPGASRIGPTPDFVAIDTGPADELAGEEGDAPTVPDTAIERGLLELLSVERRTVLLDEGSDERPELGRHSWDVVANWWADVLEDERWKTETATI